MRTLVFLICLLLKPLVHADVLESEHPVQSRVPMSLPHKATGTYGLVNQGKQPSLNSLAKNYGGSESNAFFKPMMSKDTLNNQIGGSLLGSISEHQTFNQIGNKQVSQSFNNTKVVQKSEVGDVLQFKGGAHGKLEALAKFERHHMPADSITSIPYRKGPAIQMEIADHAKTSSYGSKSTAKLYREEVSKLIESGDIRSAMAKEIIDVKKITSSKYNSAMQEMLDYAKSTNIVPKKK